MIFFIIEYKSLYPWPHALAHWPMNSYHGINNAADGKGKDGEAQYYSVENGPYGMSAISFIFIPRFIHCVLSLFFLIYGGLKVGVLGRSSLVIVLPAMKLLHLDWSYSHW